MCCKYSVVYLGFLFLFLFVCCALYLCPGVLSNSNSCVLILISVFDLCFTFLLYGGTNGSLNFKLLLLGGGKLDSAFSWIETIVFSVSLPGVHISCEVSVYVKSIVVFGVMSSVCVVFIM